MSISSDFVKTAAMCVRAAARDFTGFVVGVTLGANAFGALTLGAKFMANFFQSPETANGFLIVGVIANAAAGITIGKKLGYDPVVKQVGNWLSVPVDEPRQSTPARRAAKCLRSGPRLPLVRTLRNNYRTRAGSELTT